MKLNSILSVTVLLIFFACNSNPEKTIIESHNSGVAKQDSTQGQSEEPIQIMTWEEYMQPSKQHAELAKWEGEWDATSTVWMEPNSEPITQKGKFKREMILDGKYLKSTFTGSFMDMPFESVSIYGYNKAKNKYQLILMDNMSTSIITLTGNLSKDGDMIEFFGKSVDPTMGKEVAVKETIQNKPDGTQILESYVTSKNGELFKTLSISVKRTQ